MTSSTSRPRWSTARRVLVTVVLLLLALVLAVAGFAYKVVYRPTIDPVPDEPADALMVLGPLDSWRLPEAERLMREHKARNLVLSTPNMPWDAMYCQRKHDWPAYCFAPDPSTTRGEAMGFKSLAEKHGWSSVMVLTIDFHVDRARFIFERCLRQKVLVTGPHLSSWDSQRGYQMGYQTAGFAKELWFGRCSQ